MAWFFESLDWSVLIKKYDTADALFYLDPPYWGGEKDYGKSMFARSDFQKMADQLRELSGKFILSINDVPEVREIFDGFHMEPVQLTYTIAKGQTTAAKELIITAEQLITTLI